VQSTNTILMIEPIAFGANAETAESNIFQHAGDIGDTQAKALNEFNKLVKTLESKGVNIIRVQDTPEPITTDSIFPNNWITTHSDGTVVLYPMESKSRRQERRDDVLELLESEHGFAYKRVFDFSPHELSKKYLEGTGSLILDRVNKIAYACYASRTHEGLLDLWAQTMGYSVCGFAAAVASGDQIYHTNVMMCLGTGVAVRLIKPCQKNKLQCSNNMLKLYPRQSLQLNIVEVVVCVVCWPKYFYLRKNNKKNLLEQA